MHYPSASQAVSGIHKPNKDISAAVCPGNTVVKSHLYPNLKKNGTKILPKPLPSPLKNTFN